MTFSVFSINNPHLHQAQQKSSPLAAPSDAASYTRASKFGTSSDQFKSDQFKRSADAQLNQPQAPALRFGATAGGVGTLPPESLIYSRNADGRKAGPAVSAEDLYGLSEGVDDLAQNVRDALKKYPVAQPTQKAKENRFRDEIGVIRDFAEGGLLSVDTSEAYGGFGLDTMAASSLARALAYHDLGLATTVLVSSGRGLAGEPIRAHGTEAQKQEFLLPMLNGEKIGAFALTEPNNGSDATNITTKAQWDETQQKWVLNGEKIFITNGNIADFFIVLARTGKQLNAFIVDRDTPGVETSGIGKMGQDASDTAGITLNNVAIDADRLIGDDPTLNIGKKIITQTLEGGRVGVAAMSTGAMQRALDEAVQYVNQRPQFKNPLTRQPEMLAEKPMLREMLANMALTNEVAQLLTHQAARVRDKVEAGELPHDALTASASMAKLYASEGANKVAYDALQLHGGYGFTDEFPISKIYRDVRVMTLYEGTSQIQKLLIGQKLLTNVDPSLFEFKNKVQSLDDVIQQATALSGHVLQQQNGKIIQQIMGRSDIDESRRFGVGLQYAGAVAQDALGKFVDLAVERQGVKMLEEHASRLSGQPRAIADALLAMQRYKAAQLAIQTVTELAPDQTVKRLLSQGLLHGVESDATSRLIGEAAPLLMKASESLRTQRNVVATGLTGTPNEEMKKSLLDLAG